ncbi:Elongation of very long chain fatty acids protein 3 [Candida viswanathii]|uniref:Elongation of fatty acids protein n=1 Tax=Candida viswanathii TaxID=5486 RepID=A0A367XV97_9ASCO|nr:Elongation of very long chain fatty acids protein 3 [Candida viswanathii]
MLTQFRLPQADVWNSLPSPNTPVPESPFTNEFLSQVFYSSLKVRTPLTIALVYFTSVHFINSFVRARQLRKYNETAEKKVTADELSEKQLKKLPAAPFAIAKTSAFKFFVLAHNVFLCVYSVWTFIGFTSTIGTIMNMFEGNFLSSLTNYKPQKLDIFIHSVCDVESGVFSRILNNEGFHNLEIFGWWFYISKFYEVIDTAIILLKGRPSSLLQSYHHAGAMMSMWAGIRYQSPPIWIFVVFNSFIHSLMYLYFSLSCVHIRVPNLFKRVLTSLQIVQFVVGGSIAVLHSFVWIVDSSGVLTDDELKWISCIAAPEQALAILINVAYLMPLTALFTAFYIESYLKKKASH